LRIPDSVSHKIFQYLQLHNTSMLLEGDIFTGRVISVDSDFLLMQLLDGREISAQIKSDAVYNAGDMLKLKVVDRQQGKLIATELEHNPAQNIKNPENISRPANAGSPAGILKSLNLPVSKVNIEIVNAIISMGREPAAEIIEKALNLIEEMPIEDPKHAVLLVLNKLEGEEQYYKLVAELDNGQFHFNEELNDLIGLLEAAGDETLIELAERLKLVFNRSLIKTPIEQENQSQPQKIIPGREHEAVETELTVKTQSEKIVFSHKTEKSEEVVLPKADQWINDLKRELSVVSRVITDSTLSNKERILSKIDRLETAVHFFNDLQGFEMFVQIPFIFKENQTDGELYIMKKARGKGKINSRDFTLFLSLSTDNIGDLDIFVHVKNKNVMVKVFAENENYKPLFTNEYKSLYESLKGKGYTLFELGFELKDEKVSIFNAEKKALILLESKSKIDIKV